MAPLMTIDVDSSNTFKLFSHFERQVGVELRALAHRTGDSIRDAAKAAAPVAAVPHRSGFAAQFGPGTYRDSIIARDVKTEEGAATIVYSQMPAGTFPNLDGVLEFGTSFAAARPHLFPAMHRHEAGFRADVETILQRVADAASR